MKNVISTIELGHIYIPYTVSCYLLGLTHAETDSLFTNMSFDLSTAIKVMVSSSTFTPLRLTGFEGSFTLICKMHKQIEYNSPIIKFAQ